MYLRLLYEFIQDQSYFPLVNTKLYDYYKLMIVIINITIHVKYEHY